MVTREREEIEWILDVCSGVGGKVMRGNEKDEERVNNVLIVRCQSGSGTYQTSRRHRRPGIKGMRRHHLFSLLFTILRCLDLDCNHVQDHHRRKLQFTTED